MSIYTIESFSNIPRIQGGADLIVKAAGLLLAGLLITACENEVVQPDLEVAVIDNAATDFDPAALIMYYAVTVSPEDGQSVDSVAAELFLLPETADSSDADSLLESVALNDDGAGGDILPRDGVYGLAHAAPFSRGTVADAMVVYHAFINGTEYTLRDTLPINLPVLSEIVLNYDKLQNKIFCSVRFTSPTQTPVPDTIWAEFFSATGAVADSAAPGTLLASKELFDNQTDGDVTAGDGIYTRLFDSPFAAPITGAMRVLFVAYVDGEVHTAMDTLKMSNQLPVIDAVFMDAVVTRPAINWMYVDASDADGLEDLQSVTFQILKPNGRLGESNTGDTVFHLLDDGVDNPYLGRNDVTAGDGRYSGGLTFGATNELGTYTIMFVAMDYSNETSDTAKVDMVLQ